MSARSIVRLVSRGLVLALALWLLVGCAGQQGGGEEEEQASEEQPTDPAEVMDAYTAAINAHDVEGALALVDDEAVYGRPTGQFNGKEEIRGFIEGLVARDVHIELLGERQVEGEQVSWQSRITLNDPEDEFINNSDSIVRDGKIVSHTATRATATTSEDDIFTAVGGTGEEG
jgi:hypothetical protein